MVNDPIVLNVLMLLTLMSVALPNVSSMYMCDIFICGFYPPRDLFKCKSLDTHIAVNPKMLHNMINQLRKQVFLHLLGSGKDHLVPSSLPSEVGDFHFQALFIF